uniref:Adenine DNA glycosylase n=1 Tax=Mucochytrium quahogii TaxID=96639 RepID=A0A7S2RQD0_9STRA|mmetsp:Transcript_16236/g.28005  ORF Transcript_16236/g.28005 Transcript_16236/m.28005 type:complete len:431 (-) Transcript_16236:184-1476(-)|eukprot:CAMPEP_0203759476 /NCGR_PEP_ID=MMETSP0098-20131031/12522_1 /ASSEMBLY_ACC=CAM_ASM_000208 /TAXON_ID=96639 /ORGANISM=" , Strain NY0313808BC1" /LENGTH=430 /DNA_ID=CAMNT_0050652467 /DNA_START=270 /DNA_END=1562 /DNA_ORIENTATION=-
MEDIEDLFCAKRLVGEGNVIESVHEKLLGWYDDNRRALPWRGDCGDFGGKITKGGERRQVSAYETWISEIMLQQTRVETVIEYFKRWVKRFPTVQSLAKADSDEVNSMWAGLGYYSRARNLHAGAKKVVENFEGIIPNDRKDLLSIPGIGAYTCGAILSIAFNKRSPLVDGNVIRVFSRICAVLREAKDKHTVKGCWTLAETLIPQTRPGDFNQALMELGATVCTPQRPKCEICPIRQHCLAYSKDPQTVERYPVKSQRKVLPVENYAVTVFSKQRVSQEGEKEYLLTKRPPKGLLAGQWEFLHVPIKEDSLKCVNKRRKAVERWTAKNPQHLAPCNICRSSGQASDVGSFKHTFSHLRHVVCVESIELSVVDCKCSIQPSPGATKTPLAWMTADEMHAKGLTKITKRCLELVTKVDEPEKPKKKRKTKM